MAKSGTDSVSKGTREQTSVIKDMIESLVSDNGGKSGGSAAGGTLEKAPSRDMAPAVAPGTNSAGQPMPLPASRRPGSSYMDIILEAVAPVGGVGKPPGTRVVQSQPMPEVGAYGVPRTMSGKTAPIPAQRGAQPQGIDIPLPQRRPTHEPVVSDEAEKQLEYYLGRGIELRDLVAGAAGAAVGAAAKTLWDRTRNANGGRATADGGGTADNVYANPGTDLVTGRRTGNTEGMFDAAFNGGLPNGTIDVDFWETYNDRQVTGPQRRLSAPLSEDATGPSARNYDAPFAAFDNPQIAAQLQFSQDQDARNVVEGNNQRLRYSNNRDDTDQGARRSVENAQYSSDRNARNSVEGTVERTMNTNSGGFTRQQEAGLKEVNALARSGDMEAASRVFNSLDIDLTDSGVADAVAKALSSSAL